MNTKRPEVFEKELYSAEAAMNSVVSYPNRCKRWGDNEYRGNCDGRLFKNLVMRYGAQRVSDPMMGSGTTRDVIADLNTHAGKHIKFWGGDLKKGFNLLRQNMPRGADFIWIHPPYWNIIRYSDHPDDLSTIDNYRCFLEALEICLRRCYESLVPGGRLAILIGDVRRQRVYTPIIRDILNWEPRIGILRSILIKVQHNCHSDSKSYAAMQDVPIKHEYCAVFQKS